jgi:uncharacterized protein with von Willebrand factor type A (vWA) domain
MGLSWLFLLTVSFVYASSSELVVLLLDTSGSMAGQEAAMVEGTNAILTNMAATLERANWTGVFNAQVYTFADKGRKLIMEAPLGSKGLKLTLEQYQCVGGTPLLDVLGDTIKTIRDNSTIIVATDGEDTTSERFTLDQVKELITKARQERDIHFVYVYKNDEAFTGGMDLGFIGLDGDPGPAGTMAVAASSDMLLGQVIQTTACGASAPMFRHIENEL